MSSSSLSHSCFLSSIKTTTEIVQIQDPSPQGRFKTDELDTPLPDFDFTVTGRRGFPDDFEAMQALSSFAKKLSDKAEAIFIMHRRQEYQQEKHIQWVVVSKSKGVKYKTVRNPHWQGISGVKRNMSSPFLEQDVSVAMQAQLFAMLDRSKGDVKWMAEFDLKDYQQQDVYDWQREYLPRGNMISADRMVTLMKNVLNVVKLPWIKLIFKDKGYACCFRVKFNNKSANPEVVATSSNSEAVGWLHDASPQMWDIVGHLDKTDKIKIDKMELEFVTTWGMNPYILLHELAHYVAFCLPLKAKLNHGSKRLSYKEYELLFAGHGVLYMGVFRFLLIRFGQIEASWVDEVLAKSKVKYLNIEKLDASEIDRNLIDYVKG